MQAESKPTRPKARQSEPERAPASALTASRLLQNVFPPSWYSLDPHQYAWSLCRSRHRIFGSSTGYPAERNWNGTSLLRIQHWPSGWAELERAFFSRNDKSSGVSIEPQRDISAGRRARGGRKEDERIQSAAQKHQIGADTFQCIRRKKHL